MAEKNYSKRELDTAFRGITDHLKKQDDFNEEQFKIMNKKLDYTNGKVRLHDFIVNSIKWILGTGVAAALAWFTYLTYIK